MSNLYKEDSIESFPAPHSKEYEIYNNGSRRRKYNPGWIVRHYGNVFIKELPSRNKKGMGCSNVGVVMIPLKLD